MRLSISRVPLVVAALIALMTLGGAGYLQWSQPVHLRVAAGPSGETDAKLMAEFNRMLDATRAGVRLDVVPTADIHDSNAMLEKGDVDMAVVRLDDPLPTRAGVVALLRTDVLIAVAPARHKLESLLDVKGRRIGLISRTSLDKPGLLKILDVLGIKPADVHLTVISADQVAELTRSGQIDCVAVIGTPTDPAVKAVVLAVGGNRKNPPVILSVNLGDVDQSTPDVSAETIGKSAFPSLGIPHDDVDTVGVKTALVANSASTGPLGERIYNNAIEEVTRGLIERHGEVARAVPLASLISAPDKHDDARFPIHPGTNAYLDDTDTSWATLLSDQIWNIVLVGGGVSSVIAAAASFLMRGGTDPMLDILSRLKGITERAEASTDPADAAALSQQLREVSFEITQRSYDRRSSYEEFAPLQLAWESAREAIATLRAGPALRLSDATDRAQSVGPAKTSSVNNRA
jgi:TRAP-type uncharacterized transport system substrate-binding protein